MRYSLTKVPHDAQITIALVILIVCSIIVGVCVSLLANRHSTAQPPSEKDTSPAPSISASNTVSATAPATSTAASTTYNLDTCLELFTLSAPTSPLTYPCGQCTGPLSAVPNDFVGNGSSDKDIKNVGSVLQFCGLQSIFKNTEGASSNTSASTVLSGWMRDTNVCAGWSGLRCDPKGRVTSL